ncbi:MAG: glutamine-hydrolyzing carbamoyl-phosphate synthase small subunit [Candidatus Omnitrophica bacterium]|nr:glutamine-hydrolyzing carbamoyl-phosphate synthase small subunit [Candidatus Omnitrophota bacterium]
MAKLRKPRGRRPVAPKGLTAGGARGLRPLRPPAILALEDGEVYRGRSFGAQGEARGEVVFNTSMMGYQEILTDPSYKGQMVCMTYPLIGNYGVNPEDVESRKPFVEGFIVKEASSIVSNWRATQDLGSYLKKNRVVGIEGVDTRALTKHLREEGAKKGIISTKDLNEKSLVKKVKASAGLVGRDLIKEVTCEKAYDWNRTGKFRVVAIDSGIKLNILRSLAARGCRVRVVPATATKEEILAFKPDGLFLSNGPGDPEALPYIVNTVKSLLNDLPIFGICLGHQILGQAFGGKTFKLKFGHHGGNQPVIDLKTRSVAITAQNHGFAVDIGSIRDKNVVMTHVNLNDNTCEGMEHKTLPIFSVQYHPEAAPGPHDASHHFDKFIKLMEKSA